MVFKGELDYGSPDKMILATLLILINPNGWLFFLLKNAVLGGVFILAF